jgi:hypothetical protein
MIPLISPPLGHLRFVLQPFAAEFGEGQLVGGFLDRFTITERLEKSSVIEVASYCRILSSIKKELAYVPTTVAELPKLSRGNRGNSVDR